MVDKLLILPTASALIGREWVTLQKGQAAPFYDSRLSFYILPLLHTMTVDGPEHRVPLDRRGDASNPVFLHQIFQAFSDLKNNVDASGAMIQARKVMSLVASLNVRGGRIVTVMPDLATDGFGYGKGQYFERPLRVRDILPRLEELVDEDTGEFDLEAKHSDMPSAMLWQGDGKRPKKVKGDGRYLHEASIDVPVWAHHDLPTCINFRGAPPEPKQKKSGHPGVSAFYDRWMNRGQPVIGLKGDKPNKRLVSCKDAAAAPVDKIGWADWTILDMPMDHWSDGGVDIELTNIAERVQAVLVDHQEAHEAALSGVYVPSPMEEGDLYPANGGTSFSNPV